jgi:hypothetical protein
MKIIEIKTLSNGAHRNQNGGISTVPDGWAVIPEDMEIPFTFPFVNIMVDDGVVTEMTANEKAYNEAMKQTEEPTEEPIEASTHDMAQAIVEGVNEV